jgi:hypothetical protein
MRISSCGKDRNRLELRPLGHQRDGVSDEAEEILSELGPAF